MGFDIFFRSVSEPVQSGIFIMSLVCFGFALGYWAGKKRTKINHWNVKNASFPVMAGGTVNVINKKEQDND